MAKRNKPPELTFQQHIADYLVREHGYGVLEQGDITDTEHCIAEDQLWAFLKATQADALKKLEDDYGTDARDEVFKALRKELAHTPLWLILRNGLEVRARVRLQLFYPKPRSNQSAANDGYPQNRITFRPHFYFGETNKEIDFVLFLNGLPIVALELKHEANQTVHDAVAQFAGRDHTRKIFQHPFLYLAADTCDVMAATDPRREENFRWHNTGLNNAAQNPDEYPVEFLYREVLSKEQLLEALSFFLVRVPEREADEPDADVPELDPEEQLAKVIREHDVNQLFVAFTATPAQATVDLFGAAFDTYTEAEAIAEGYIVDVAASIISYKTLYHLHCHFVPNKDEEEKVYPKGVVSKALMNVAFQDDGLIQYKSEVMLRIFEEQVMPLINGRAKAMIVTSSRVAGLRYFDIITEKLKERGAAYKVLYAFSDFTHPETNAEIHEHAVNGLKDGELIEDRFGGDDYRLMVVANKFQTGFNQPLLAGMFLDKPVMDRNAVQTVSRLNRKIDGKDRVIVVDFTNNAAAILKAFAKYRKGTPFEPGEPDEGLCPKLYADILAAGVFTQKDAAEFVKLAATGTDAQVQFLINALRTRFHAKIADAEERKAFVYLLARYVKTFHFLTSFFTYSAELQQFAAFADYVGPQLIKQGSVSDLMKQIRQTEVIKAAVEYQGVTTSSGQVKLKPGHGKKGSGPPPKKVSVQDMIAEIRAKFEISDEEALYIKQVTEEKSADPAIRDTVVTHRDDRVYLEGAYRGQVNGEIQAAYEEIGRYDELADLKYTDTGGIFDIMAVTVIQTHLTTAA